MYSTFYYSLILKLNYHLFKKYIEKNINTFYLIIINIII